VPGAGKTTSRNPSVCATGIRYPVPSFWSFRDPVPGTGFLVIPVSGTASLVFREPGTQHRSSGYENEKGGQFLAALSLARNCDQVQVMRPFAEDEQVFEVSVCEAAAVHVAGGPATAVAVTVTFCEGEKPWADPLPEKYVPELSAA